MSSPRTVPTTAVERQESKKQLAEMIKAEFGLAIHPNHLGYWLKANWSILATLAHHINDVPQRSETK
jgi:hypothetical protein